MLKVIGHSSSVPEDFIIEYGIPLKIKWGELSPRFYWSTGHPKYSLIEFGISKDTSVLSSITLVSPNKVRRSSTLYIPENIMEVTGLPICEVQSSSQSEIDYVESSYDFEIYLKEDLVHLVVQPYSDICYQITTGSVKLGLDKNHCLCLVSLKNIPSKAMTHMLETINSILEQRRSLT